MTERFAANWLTLREPVDAASRSRALASAFSECLPPQPLVIDLGAGRGANARYLENLRSIENEIIRWRLIDHDEALLDEVNGLRHATVEILDFSTDQKVIDFLEIDAVTASALFDLVSKDWFAAFVSHVAPRPLLLALTADKFYRWHPRDPFDNQLMNVFENDMRRDKGFGPAMGTEAPEIMSGLLSQAGYRVRSIASNWHLDSRNPGMLHTMIETISEVAMRHGKKEIATAWRERRKSSVAAAALTLEIGHSDILAIPAGNRDR